MVRKQGLALGYSVLFLFLLFDTVSASQLANHDVVVDVDEQNVAHFYVVMNFIELNAESVNYLVFAKVSNARAKDVLGELACSVEKETYGAQISCVPNSKMNENYTVELTFDAGDLVRRSGNAELFSYSYGIKDPTNSFGMKILLPEGAALLSAAEFDPYFPEGAVIATDMGRRVSLEWAVVKPELGRTYTYDSYFEFVGKPVEPQNGDSEGGMVSDTVVALLFILAALFAISYYLWFKNKKKSVGNVKRVFSVLKDDERKVIDVILQKGEKCKQRDIVHLTDYSKAKVSRIMTELEDRGIISRVRVGRTNRITLNENLDLKSPKKS